MTKRIRIERIGWLLGVALGTALAMPAQQGKEVKEAKTTAGPKTASAAARGALRSADGVLAQAKGTKGEDRQARLRAAAAAYEKVAADFAKEPIGSAPACYKAGEVRRKLGELAKAAAHYQQAVDRDATRFAERGFLQLAHLARRQKNHTRALELYAKVSAIKPTSARAHQARMWAAGLLSDAGSRDEAVAAYRRALASAASPRQTIDGCNRLAGLLVKMGRLDAAEKVIAQAATAAQPAPGAKGKAAERAARTLAKAYAKMSARRALQRARDKATKAHKDAAALEKGKPPKPVVRSKPKSDQETPIP